MPALAADRERLASGNLRSKVETLETALTRANKAFVALRDELPPTVE